MASQTDDSHATRLLLEAAAGGDRRACEALFARHQPFLRRLVSRRLDRQLVGRLDVSDVVQETQLDAFRQLPSYLRRRPMPFRVWLFRTAHQRIAKLHRDHLRAARRAISREVPLPDHSSIRLAGWLVDRGPTPSDSYRRRERAQQVRDVLGELSESDREIILLRNLDGLSNSDAASVLGIQPETAKKRYARALVRLQKRLARRGLGEAD